MCNYLTFHHQFRIDAGKSKFERTTDSIPSAFGSMDKEHKDLEKIDLEAPRLARYMRKSMDETSKYGILGRHQPCSKD